MNPKKEIQQLKTFDDFDKLDLKPFAERLIKFIKDGNESLKEEEGSYTISLNADFGNGKTTFLEMFQDFIKTEDKYKDKYEVLFIDAWRSDFYKEPIITILLELATYFKKGLSIKDLPSIDAKLVGNLISIAGDFTPVPGLKTAGDTLKALSGDDILKDFEKRKKYITDIKEAISEYLDKANKEINKNKPEDKKINKKIIIIIDELDRARPDYAVRFLEDMKHFFDIKDVVFIVGVNRKQMEATVKCRFGQDTDFNSYYSKFFKNEMSLPNPYDSIKEFLKREAQKLELDLDQDSISYTKDSCKNFKLSLREIEVYLRIYSYMLNKISEKIQAFFENWPLVESYSFFICVYLKEKNLFNKILENKLDLKDFLDEIEKGSFSKFRPKQLIVISCTLINFLFAKSDELEQQKNLIKSFFNKKYSISETEIEDVIENTQAILHFSELPFIPSNISVEICSNIEQAKRLKPNYP